MEGKQKIPQGVSIINKDSEKETKKEVSKKQLINKLNYINFQDGTVLINLKHTKYNSKISLHAKLQPCHNDCLECIWIETEGLHQKLKSYEFQNLLVNDGQNLLLVKPEMNSISVKGISLVLPEKCYEISSRKVRRHLCKDINVSLFQNGALFYGSLIDFSAVSFRVEVSTAPPQTFEWVNPEFPVNVVFSEGPETLYSGECRIIRQTRSQKTRNYVLEPLSHQIQRFKPKEFRSTRQKLTPSPNTIFIHPFTKKMVNLKVVDLSGSGFSVEEDEYNTVLLPGMIIPELELTFASSFKIKCKAQVVYRICGEEEENNWVKCGLSILDMDIQDHVRLIGLLHQAQDKKSYVSNKVDMDALWNFFFETGFIYPKKYAHIEANKEKIKETYEKLYTQNPNIARHFIYQDKGRIMGHMAMVRFYENSWLIHHHAADSSASLKAGLIVLSQISHYVNNLHNLFSAHLNFVFCYFRPENKFPNRVFGGVARNIKNPKGCSIDTFAYFHLRRIIHNEADMSEPWRLVESRSEDLLELESFYEHESGGLMIHALDLEPGKDDIDELSKEYQRLGFKRERHLFSLKKHGRLKAIIMVNIADIALNLSDLTNCIKVVVLDPVDLPKNTLYLIISMLYIKFKYNELPVLLYPVSYAESQSIPFEKLYTLWVLDLQYLDHYFKFCNTYFRRI